MQFNCTCPNGRYLHPKLALIYDESSVMPAQRWYALLSAQCRGDVGGGGGLHGV